MACCCRVLQNVHPSYLYGVVRQNHMPDCRIVPSVDRCPVGMQHIADLFPGHVNMVYIGQASDLAKRLNQHLIGKDWWESAIILTTQSKFFNRSDIDYLEAVLINRAKAIGRLDSDNKQKGNTYNPDKFRKVLLVG